MTTVRLLLIVPFVLFMLQGDHMSAGLTALVAIISDIDGTVARKLHATSKFGALYDPFVDIAFIITGLYLLVHFGELHIVFAIAFLASVCLKAIPQARYLRRHKEVRSVFAGKTAAVLGFAAVVSGAFGIPYAPEVLLTVGTILYVLVALRAFYW